MSLRLFPYEIDFRFAKSFIICFSTIFTKSLHISSPTALCLSAGGLDIWARLQRLGGGGLCIFLGATVEGKFTRKRQNTLLGPEHQQSRKNSTQLTAFLWQIKPVATGVYEIQERGGGGTWTGQPRRRVRSSGARATSRSQQKWTPKGGPAEGAPMLTSLSGRKKYVFGFSTWVQRSPSDSREILDWANGTVKMTAMKQIKGL